MSYDPEKPLSELEHSDPDTQLRYFRLEPSHVPEPGYSELYARKLSRKYAQQIMREFITYDEGDSVVPYLALTYFDNFIGFTASALSKENTVMKNIETTRKRIHGVAGYCFILASRKRNPEFCPDDFLNKQKLNHMKETIDEIRPVVDFKLQHRKMMEPVTALCFLDYLTGLLIMKENVREVIKSFATHKLYAYHTDIRSTKFLPSIVAAVAIISSVRTFYNEKTLAYTISEFRKCEYIDEKTLLLALDAFFPNNYILVRNPSAPYPDFHSATVDNENLAETMCQRLKLATDEKVIEPEKELKMTKERLQDSEKEIINLKKDFESKKSESVSHLQEQLKLATKELNAERREVSKLQKRIIRYQTRQSEREQEIRSLKDAVSDVEQNLSLENKKLKDQISTLIDDRARLEKNLEESNQKTKNLEEGVQKVELEKKKLEKRLKCEIEHLKADVSGKSDHVKDLNKKIDALVVTNEALILEKDELEKKVADLQAQTSAAEEQLDVKSVTSPESSEHVSEDDGSSVHTRYWPMTVYAQPQTRSNIFTFKIAFGSILVRVPFIFLNHSVPTIYFGIPIGPLNTTNRAGSVPIPPLHYMIIMHDS